VTPGVIVFGTMDIPTIVEIIVRGKISPVMESAVRVGSNVDPFHQNPSSFLDIPSALKMAIPMDTSEIVMGNVSMTESHAMESAKKALHIAMVTVLITSGIHAMVLVPKAGRNVVLTDA